MNDPRPAYAVPSARDLPSDSHLCWAFADRAEFQARTAEYLAEAVDAGVPIQYIGSGSVADLRVELRHILGAIPVGTEVFTLNEFYEIDARGVVRPEATLKARAAAAETVRQPRIVVDATDMVRTAEQREAFARWEFLADGQIPALGSALCAYDKQVLAPSEVAELACMHPFVSRGSALFRIYAQPGASFALAGEVDRSCRPLFARALERVLSLCPEGPLVVDARRLIFIDHHGLHTLASAARRRGTTVLLRTAAHSATVELVRVLGLTDRIAAEAA